MQMATRCDCPIWAGRSHSLLSRSNKASSCIEQAVHAVPRAAQLEQKQQQLTHSTINPHFRTFTRTQGRVHRRNFADPASQPAQFSVTSMVSSVVVTLKDIYTDSQRQTVWFVDDSTHLQTICPQSGPFVSSHPLHPGPPLFFSRGHRLAGGREMMSVGLSYGEDGSVKMAESASLVHGNLAVLQGLEEGGLAYGLVSRNVAAITYASSTGAIASESVGFPGSQEDVSSRTLTGVRSHVGWCAFIRD